MLMLIRCPLFPTFLLFFYCYSNQWWIPVFFDCILPVVYRGGTGIKSRYLFVVVVSSSLPPVEDIRVGSGLVSTVFIHDGFQFVLSQNPYRLQRWHACSQWKCHVTYGPGSCLGGHLWQPSWINNIFCKRKTVQKILILFFLKLIRFSYVLLDMSHSRVNHSKFHQ